MPARKLRPTLMMSLVFALGAVTPAPWATAEGRTSVDLKDASVTFVPNNEIAPLGDVNGDGWPDVFLRARCFHPELPDLTYVVFGPLEEGPHSFDPDSLPGFAIEGTAPGDGACMMSQTPVGDINGDGLDDIVVGAPFSSHDARRESGAAYVIFGKNDDSTILLSHFDDGSQGDSGYLVKGPHPGALTGHYVAGLGDVDADGLGDLALGSPFPGRTYVVFGKPSPDELDLHTFDSGTQGSAGYVIRTRGASHSDGYSVGAAGDVNADGIPDVVIGSVGEVNESVGRAYVVFGKDGPAPIDARHLKGTGLGFKIRTLHGGDSGGRAVAGAGDVNGDGRDDVLIGVPRDTSLRRGVAFVVFGKKRSSPVDLVDLEGKGFKIRGATRRDAAGAAVAGAGDVNGDGLEDFLIGAYRDEVDGRGLAGSVYLVYGQKGTSTIRLGCLWTDQGVRFIGREEGDRTGRRVAGPGDLNGDGIPEIMISSSRGGYSDIIWGLSWED